MKGVWIQARAGMTDRITLQQHLEFYRSAAAQGGWREGV